MGWLKGLLHPTRQSHEDLEREAAEELRQLTADARGPDRPRANGTGSSKAPRPARRAPTN